MLRIEVPPVEAEYWSEEKQEFVYQEAFKGQVLQLEHSLVSLSKWESKHHKRFLDDDNKTSEEMLDYVRCMTITQNVDPKTYDNLTQKNLQEIKEYIEDPMTATTFNETSRPARNSERISAELIYYWMIALNIPPEYQKWHLNRLLTLIRVCNIKNTPAKKMSNKDILSRNRALNAARLKKHHTRG